VWCPEHGEDRGDVGCIHARSAEAAAEQWAEDDDCASHEYSIANGHPVVVHVAAVGSDEVAQCRVTGEVVPQYDALVLGNEHDG
jgi:hypothetical protein